MEGWGGVVIQRLSREMVLVKADAGRLIEMSIRPAGPGYDGSCQAVREAARGGDLMPTPPPAQDSAGLEDAQKMQLVQNQLLTGRTKINLQRRV